MLFSSCSDLVADDFEKYFAQKFRRIASYHEQAYGIEIDVEEEITKYQQLALEIKPFVAETVSYLHDVLSSGKKVLVEGANASMLVQIFINIISVLLLTIVKLTHNYLTSLVLTMGKGSIFLIKVKANILVLTTTLFFSRNFLYYYTVRKSFRELYLSYSPNFNTKTT